MMHKPLKECHPPRLKERPTRMTMIGAMRCMDGVVLLADGQETITDYAKWDVQKMKKAEFNGAIRIAMTGAGDADTIDMIWEKVSELWGSEGGSHFIGFMAGIPNWSIKEWRAKIVATVREITKETIIPSGESNTQVELLWMIQDTAQPPLNPMWPFELFRTFGLRERNVRPYYFGGNPILLTRYLSDLYLKNFLWSTEEAQALAAYLLWEAKERDPTVGKQSDIAIFKRDGTSWRVTYEEVAYWEDHFRVLKREMAILPLLSCAPTTTRANYGLSDRMERLELAMKTLVAYQQKMREGKLNRRIDTSLVPQIRRLVQRQEQRKKAKQPETTPSDSQTSED
jgi:hypothetical protein